MRCHIAATSAVLATVAVLSLSVASGGDEIRDSLFRSADAAMEQAKSRRADLLSPVSYSRARDHYDRASTAFSRGRDLERIQKDLQEVEEDLARASKASGIASLTFADVLECRRAALDAKAPERVPDVWQGAESKLKDAAEALERGRASAAKRRTGDLEEAYRTVEVEALKAKYLGVARARLRQAGLMSAETYVPQTLKRARDLAGLVEIKLGERDYDPEEVERLSEWANRDARRAAHLAARVQRVVLGRETLEEAFLSWEDQIDRLSSALELTSPAGEQGDDLVSQMVEKIGNQQARIEALGQGLAFQEDQVRDLKLGMSGLEVKLNQETRSRHLLARLDALFDEAEATVLRRGSEVIIRLSGLSFRVARSAIRPEHYALLGKLQEAIEMFPESSVTIEGHTDAYGTDAENLRLSAARARAVREYLVANVEIAPEGLQAAGLGESRPIASNETPGGRAMNRRIDVVLRPISESLLGVLR